MLSFLRYYYAALFWVAILWFLYEERRASLVERDVDEDVTLDPVIFNTLNVPSEYSAEYESRSALVTKKSSSNAEPDTCALSNYYSTTEATKSYGQIIREAFTSTYPQQRSFKKISTIVSTTVRTDRCMTELTLLNPFSYDKQQIVHLGIYIATFRQYGDHIVYKMSPLSPFYSLNLREQDRLVKVNGFDVTNWSHSALVNFFLHLSHNDQARFLNSEKLTKFTIEIEFVKPSPPAISSNPQHRPLRLTATVNIIMQENGRISLSSTSVTPISVTYLNRTSCSLLKLGSSTDRYVKIEEVNVSNENSSTSETGTVLRVTEGERLLGDKNAKITFHEFDISPRNQPGKIVAMETFREGYFLHAGNSTAGTSISLTSNTDSSNIQNITTSESRLFRIFSSEGNILSKILHIESGLYLKAENGEVSLASSPVTNSMLFRVFQC